MRSWVEPLRRAAGAAGVFERCNGGTERRSRSASAHDGGPPPPRSKTLRVSLPEDLRRAMLPDLPASISLSPGNLHIQAEIAEEMLQSLLALAMVIQNNLDHFRAVIEPRPAMPEVDDNDLRGVFERLREAELSGERFLADA